MKIDNPEVAEVFNSYPEPMRQKLMFLRQLILETAAEAAGVDEPEETLKWGEPSYITRSGSTVRLGWKKSDPDQYALYFHCKTTLVDMFKEIYGNSFRFEGNRAILFNYGDEIPVEKLKHCILLALTYRQKKVRATK